MAAIFLMGIRLEIEPPTGPAARKVAGLFFAWAVTSPVSEGLALPAPFAYHPVVTQRWGAANGTERTTRPDP